VTSARPPGGAVRYQREQHECPSCGRLTTHVRAVRVADGWHSDWTCLNAVAGGCSDPPRPSRCRSEVPVPSAEADP